MEPKQLSELPLVFQVIAGFGLFFGTFMLAIGGWVWKNIKSKLPESITHAVEGSPNDVVIQSATIADSQSIKSLAAAIDRLIDLLRENAEDTEHSIDRSRRVLCEIRDAVGEVRDKIDGLDKHMKGRTIV